MVHAPEVGFILREKYPLFYHIEEDSSLRKCITMYGILCPRHVL